MLAHLFRFLILTVVACGLVLGDCFPVFAAGGVPMFSAEKPNDLIRKIGTRKLKIVFIPGILGSKLADGQTGETVWGDTDTDDSRLLFDGSSKLLAEVLKEFEVSKLTDMFNIDVYGKALKELEADGIFGPDDILTFAYDWRQSNRMSADDLDNWLCQSQQLSKLDSSRVIFVAHSMGGLVLKHWFINYFDGTNGCLAHNPGKFDVSFVFFVGTPHLGSPKALTALFGYYSLSNIWFVGRYASKGLNLYGYSFDSIYELLPVQHDEACTKLFGQAGGLPRALSEAGDNGEYKKIFNLNFMQSHDLPASLTTQRREEFRAGRLAQILENASRNVCQLATYDFPKFSKDRIIAVMGLGEINRHEKNTDFELLRSSGGLHTAKGNGDGTVLQVSASWQGVIDQVRNVHSARNNHMKLLNDDIVQQKISMVANDVAGKDFLALRETDPNKFNEIVESLVRDGKLFYTPPDDPQIEEAARGVNSQILAKFDLSPMDVAAAAKVARASTQGNNEISYVLNDYVARLEMLPEETKYLAEGAVAKELLDLGYENRSYQSLNSVIPQYQDMIERAPEARLSPNLIDALKTATGNALNTRAIISQHNGELEKAFEDFSAATEFGSAKAQNNLEQLKRLPQFRNLHLR